MAIALIKTRWILLCLVVLPFSAQIPGCMMANTPKFGRIVDATGKGMDDVAVIGLGEFQSDSFMDASSGGYAYRVVTRTDANGNYWIPNTWMHVRFAFPGMSAQYHWYITALKPGYAIAADIPAIGKLDKIPPVSLADSPSAFWLGLAIRISPIEMTPVTLSLDDAAGYYGYIAYSGLTPSYDPNQKEEIALRKEGADYFLPRICSVNSDQQVGWGPSMAEFAHDHREFFMKIYGLDLKWHEKPVNHTNPYLPAKIICDNLKQSWNMR